MEQVESRDNSAQPGTEAGDRSSEASTPQRGKLWIVVWAAAIVLGIAVASILLWKPWAGFPGQRAGEPRSARDAALQAELAAIRQEGLAVAEELVARFPRSPDAICTHGLILARYGDRRQAVRSWRRCLALAPGHVDACFSLGEDAFQAGRYQEAVDWFQQALDSDPMQADVLLSLGKAFDKLGHNEQAATAYQRHVQLAPQSVEGWFHLGQAYLRMGRYREAKQAHETAIRIDPDCKLAYYGLANACERLGHKGDATKYRREFARRESKDRAPVQGRRRHRYDDRAALRESLAYTHLAAGRVYAAHGDFQQAAAHWRRTLEIAPRHTEARSALVSLYEQQGQLDQAAELLREACRLEPKSASNWLQLGGLEVRRLHLDDAENAFSRAAELAPDTPEPFVALAQLCIHENRDPQRAKKAAQTAVRLAPIAANYFLLATVCDRTGDMPGALTAIRRAMELEPGNPLFRDVFNQVFAKWRAAAPVPDQQDKEDNTPPAEKKDS